MEVSLLYAASTECRLLPKVESAGHQVNTGCVLLVDFNSAPLCPLSMHPMTVILFIYNYLLNCKKFCEFRFSGLKLKCMVLGHRPIVLSFLEDFNC